MPKDFKKPPVEELRKRLTPEQFEVTQNDGTEPAFRNLYWNNHEPGIYVDVVSGEPLFSSKDQFDSGTGWPSFTRPLETSNIVEKKERHFLFFPRTEVRSKHAGSHLGHVFNDGPPPTGLRYCMNSAAMRFVPVSKLKEEGYGRYLDLFGKKDPPVASVSSRAGVVPGSAGLETATFAGGCFWCMVPPFEKVKGVSQVVSGYTGGTRANPTYEEVSSGTTGHAESIQVTFDPKVVGYRELLEVFWRNVDPLDSGGQFCDRGNQYRSAIFYHSEEQKKAAEASKEQMMKSGRFGGGGIATEIVAATPFYPAEEYHQDYYRKNPIRYRFYRYRCGRDQVLEKYWGKQPEH